MRTASLVGTSVSSTSANSRGTRDSSFAFRRSERVSAFRFSFFGLGKFVTAPCKSGKEGSVIQRERENRPVRRRAWGRANVLGSV